ncbi:MAG: cysteine desulfurase-like protein [Planctomycetes bacterium]|nr:cysteine desulfurase-like protein [Planctomycetota bacterium]
MHPPLDVIAVRRRFPGLLRRSGDVAAVFFDGPAGSQVPRSVADAMTHQLLYENANHGGAFATSVATDAMVQRARAAVVDFVGGDDPEEVVFGANMTTLTFHLAHALARTWRPGDEVVVTDSDHDANVTPWVRAAAAAGCGVQRIAVRPDASLDLDDAERKITARTRLVAFGAASNLSGTVHPVARLCELARARGARTFVDAVHEAPHARLQAARLGCDFLVCSAYKFFGPHLGVLWGRRALLEAIEADRVRPAAAHGAEKWQTGTANFEAIAGTLAAVDYLAKLGSEHGGPEDRRGALDAAFATIERHERELSAELLRGLADLPDVRVIGIADPDRAHERRPTVSFTHASRSPRQLAAGLTGAHVYCWPGNSYALALTTALGLEPDGVLRLGMLHYNTRDEVRYVLAQLRRLLTGSLA